MSKLSQSKHPAYHLRPNKAIDRSIFLKLLRVLDSYRILNDYVYVGLGGPFLEDFRLMADQFPKMHMFSVEIDGETHKRQKFHQCSPRLTLLHRTFRDFLSSGFPSDRPTITWLDYIDFSRQSLLEVSSIARTVLPLSVIRITVNAETDLYDALKPMRRGAKRISREQRVRFDRFVDDYRKSISIQDVAYDEDLFKFENFMEETYPNLIARLIYSVITSACSPPRVFLPLHTVKYSDGTIMLSVTGMICLEKDKTKLTEYFKTRCEFVSADPYLVETIDVPMLTTKERLHLECKMPKARASGRSSTARLRYLVEGDNSEDLNQYKMGQYEKYHGLYPYFGKLIP